MTAQFFPSDAIETSAQAGRLSCRFNSIGQRLVAWANTCVDHWEAAAIYEQLSALSDVELGRRGLSRAGLAQDVHDAVESVSSGTNSE